MALTLDGDTIKLLVAKPGTGLGKYPSLYSPSAEDLNKFDFAHCRVIGSMDSSETYWLIALIDTTSYYQ